MRIRTEGLDPIEYLNLQISAGAVAVSLVLAPAAVTWGIAAGALLEAVNFRALRGSAQHLFAGSLGDSRAWVGVYGLRMALLAAAIGGVLEVGAHPLGLLLGLSLVVPAVLIHAWRTRPAIDPNAPALAADDPAWEAWDTWRACERDEEKEA